MKGNFKIDTVAKTITLHDNMSMLDIRKVLECVDKDHVWEYEIIVTGLPGKTVQPDFSTGPWIDPGPYPTPYVPNYPTYPTCPTQPYYTVTCSH